MDEYTKLKLSQLDIAQESSIVVYSRERTGVVLGRKIRAEFGRVYISNEVKDCQKALSKIKNDTIDSHFEVDCVIIEYDTSSLKLIDYINKRPLSPETSNCALIPTVVVVPEDVNLAEAEENIRNVGGANKVLNPPLDTKQVLLATIDLLYNRKRVEDTFQSLKKVQFIASKYPYVPIFGGKSPKKFVENHNDVASLHSGSTSVSAADFKLDEIDDVTDCSSLYPEYLKAVPKDQLPSIRNAVKKKRELTGEEKLALLEAEEMQNRMEAERLKLEQQNIRKQPSHDPNELMEDSISERPSEILDIAFPSMDLTQSENARVDSRVLMEDEYSSIFSEYKDTKSKKNTINTSQKPRSLKFLDPSCRPYWSGTLNADAIGKTKGADIKYDIRPFVEKQPPSMIRPSTVGGLDKRSVTRYWQHFGNGTTGRMDNHKAGHRHEDKHERSLSPPSSPGKEHVVVVHHDLPRIPESRVSAPSSPRMHQAASSSDLSRAMQRRPSTSGMSMGSDGSKDYLAYMRATKQISQIARTAAPDYQLDKILDVDLSHRKINQGEKDMLIRAINLEKEGDVDSAIILYTRAGAHSKEQQISKMLLGNLHYRQKKFMAALNFYNFAIKILHAKNESVRILQDEFLSHYNRSVINFRLGNDEMGMQDIESAVKLDPTHIQAREVLSIARRRMGKFTQAIEEAVSLKTQRLEKIRLEKLQAKQAQHQQDEISSSRETSPSRSTGPGISRNNSPSRDGIVIPSNRIFSTQFGGFQLKIKEPSAKNGVREKIAEGKTMMRGEGVSIGQSTEGGFLKMFKLNNGLEMELFDDLFKRPSLLQHALLVEPSMRTVEQYQIIRDTLKLFPFLRSLPESLMQELGRIIEYRTLTGKEEIFGQNEESAAVCMLLHGHIQVRQDYPNTGLIGVTLGELGDFSTFGHIDNLFRKPRSTLLKAIEECLLPHYMKLQKLAVNSGVDSGAAENTRDDLSVDTMDDEDNEVYQRFTNEFKRMWDSELHSGDLDRAIMPGMFMTYTMTSACEFFFIPEREFNRVLLDTALEELKTRLRAIVSSGIFQQWSMEDIIRLSRMGQIKSYRRGEVILEQGKRPDFFCIILKGLCRVTKKPNRTEMLYQKLHAALEKADQHDLKYVFHNTVSRVVLVHKTEEDKKQKATSKDKGGKEKSSKDKSNKRSNKNGKNASNNTSSLQKMSDPAEMLRKFSTDIPYQVSPPTEAEKARQELQAEIDKLQGLIQKAHAQDAFDNREDRTTHSYGSKTDKSYCLVTSDHPSKVSELAGHLSGKVSEITTLQWPRIFGEACISDPENGISRGSIIADTYCEVFALHRSQIQTFPVDKEFIDRVKAKAVAYPMDPDLVVNLYKGIEWRHYKEEMMTSIPKSRWPKRLDDLEPFLTGP